MKRKWTGAVKPLLAIFAATTVAFLGFSRASAREDPQTFVQHFYDWYAPRAASPHPFGFEDALKLKPAAFAPPLARALQEDADAQAKVHDDIVGIDFDPILNSQDPCTKYRAGKAVPTATGFRVEVYEAKCEGGEIRKKPAVVVDLAPGGDSWVITDFEYDFESQGKTSHQDVLQILQQLAEERAHPSASSP
jgi:hypothetical protein